MKKILVATGNAYKIKMFRDLLKNVKDIDFLYLTDFPKVETPIEDGDTINDNALIKAKYYFEKFGIPVLSDDAGFEVKQLGGEPGIMARRRGGLLPDDVSDENRLNFFLDKIKDIPGDKVDGSFPFCRCLYLGLDNYFFQNEVVEFYLSKNPRRPYHPGSPTSALRIFLDGRHELDVSADDHVWQENMKAEGLIKLLENIK